MPGVGGGETAVRHVGAAQRDGSSLYHACGCTNPFPLHTLSPSVVLVQGPWFAADALGRHQGNSAGADRIEKGQGEQRQDRAGEGRATAGGAQTQGATLGG